MDEAAELARRQDFTRRIREALALYNQNITTPVTCTPWGENTAYRIEIEFIVPNGTEIKENHTETPDERIIAHAVQLVRAWYEDQHEDLLFSFRDLSTAVNESGRLDQLYREQTEGED